MSAIVVNLFGVPSAGKSTGAANIYSKLKLMGINAELINEFAKDKVWEESTEAFNNQAYILGQQSFKQSRCSEKVDVIVTDSPLPLSIFYNKDENIAEGLSKLTMQLFHKYNNLNFLIKRTKKYSPIGRFQTEEESNELAEPIRKLLEDNDINYEDADGDEGGYDHIVSDILGNMIVARKIKTIIQWRVVGEGNDARLTGMVFGDNRFEDGTTVLTSKILNTYKKNLFTIVETENGSTYYLMEIAKGYEKTE